jgi:hypothetical protein
VRLWLQTVDFLKSFHSTDTVQEAPQLCPGIGNLAWVLVFTTHRARYMPSDR